MPDLFGAVEPYHLIAFKQDPEQSAEAEAEEADPCIFIGVVGLGGGKGRFFLGEFLLFFGRCRGDGERVARDQMAPEGFGKACS